MDIRSIGVASSVQGGGRLADAACRRATGRILQGHPNLSHRTSSFGLKDWGASKQPSHLIWNLYCPQPCPASFVLPSPTSKTPTRTSSTSTSTSTSNNHNHNHTHNLSRPSIYSKITSSNRRYKQLVLDLNNPTSSGKFTPGRHEQRAAVSPYHSLACWLAYLISSYPPRISQNFPPRAPDTVLLQHPDSSS